MSLYRVLTSDGKTWFVDIERSLYIINAINATGVLKASTSPALSDKWTIVASQIVAWAWA